MTCYLTKTHEKTTALAVVSIYSSKDYFNLSPLNSPVKLSKKEVMSSTSF